MFFFSSSEKNSETISFLLFINFWLKKGEKPRDLIGDNLAKSVFRNPQTHKNM